MLSQTNAVQPAVLEGSSLPNHLNNCYGRLYVQTGFGVLARYCFVRQPKT